MKLIEFFKKIFGRKPKEQPLRQSESADVLLRYFIELEHYNFMEYSKNYITMKQFQSFFTEEPVLRRRDFVTYNGKPMGDMSMFLETKGSRVKGVYLREKSASLFYLPVAKEEVLRYFASLANKSNSFMDFKEKPDSFLIHVKLDHMLKIDKEAEQRSPLVISPIVRFLLRTGKTLEGLQHELEQAIGELTQDEGYGRMDHELAFQDEEDPNLLKDLKFIHIRYQNWRQLNHLIHGVLQSYLAPVHLQGDGILRFGADAFNTHYEILTFDEYVGINSFYLKDLKAVHTALHKKQIGQALKTYLAADQWEVTKQSKEQVDFFSHSSITECKRILRQMPPAKWPSKYPLGLMQQVALNIIFEKYKKEDGFLFSVNGPPGTGKTTLLKDVFANILVEKVKFLQREQAIIEEIKYGPGEEDIYYTFHPKLKDFRMLVVSNNNAAVENISKELPEDEVLLGNHYRFFGSGQSEWGTISSALGKKKNREQFFEKMMQKLEAGIPEIEKDRDSLEQIEKSILKKIQAANTATGLDDIDHEQWQKSEEQYINVDEGSLIRCERSKLFGLAMEQYEQFIYTHFEKIKKNMELAQQYIVNGRHPLSEDINNEKRQAFIQAMFDTVFLISPILSSTFASIASFLKDLKKEDIGWLFIDEAGQASPQSAVGAIWRSKRAVVVGDPLQIPPVVTLSHDQLKFIATNGVGMDEKAAYFHKVTRPEASAQEYADLNNKYGGQMEDDRGNRIWLGCPLRVHRRCADPMFTICNKTTYQNKMLYGTKHDKLEDGKVYTSQWLHVPGQTAQKGDHFVQEQAEQAFKIAQDYVEEYPHKTCFMITPFMSVKQGLERMNKQMSVCNVKIGTVHTFQGKEAPLVLLVLGVNDGENGPLRWASDTPNLLNVAASRAKEYFVVIGNKETWGKVKYFEVALKELNKTANNP
ncbi:DNA2/NAM7 family helicase [Lederbergia sp. NSJ-179]|uniref:DEAD/DEAH box helicase n=1 Tax=Lederbergia sp. NSJ-179 TaxID=2931402 RepID=UPI001FD475C9|nr:DEAD/DEAH box helicase [Lederbergia sp. NSJ-179]MCJ7841648.1 DNA2/NAM7 family helicase [Lederbergia sp. NSJ-179]